MARSVRPAVPGIVAHAGIPGPGPFIATGLFFAGFGAAYGAFAILRGRAHGGRRALAVGLGATSFACFAMATALPVLLHATPTLTRPSTTARVRFVSPAPGAVELGDPATFHVVLQLRGGKLAAFSSLRLVPNEGHIHLYLDGELVAMSTSTTADVRAGPGTHRLTAEFVAVDHGPFRPPVRTTVEFAVRP